MKILIALVAVAAATTSADTDIESLFRTTWERTDFRERDLVTVTTLMINDLCSVTAEIRYYGAITTPEYHGSEMRDWMRQLDLRHYQTLVMKGRIDQTGISLDVEPFGVISIPYDVHGDTLTLNVPGQKELVFSRVEQVPTAVNTTSWGSVKSSLK